MEESVVLVEPGVSEVAGEPSPESSVGPPKGYEGVPKELWPDAEGNPPVITERLLKSLRGKYFTVRHVRLGECDHLLDMINQPKNNCPDCWWTWFQTHPQLMETADQFYRTQGRKPLVAMRGLVFVRMFERTMATIIHRQREEHDVSNRKQGNDAGSGNSEANVESNNDETRASGTGDASGGDDQGRKVEGGRISSGLIQHEG